MKKEPIVLKVKVRKSEIIRLQPDATNLIRKLQGETGLSASEIASQILVKAVRECGVRLEYEPVEDSEYVQMS